MGVKMVRRIPSARGERKEKNTPHNTMKSFEPPRRFDATRQHFLTLFLFCLGSL